MDECTSDGGNTLLYSYDNSISPQPCINECPRDQPYTYEGGKICFKDCKFYKDGYCTDSCSTEYIHPGNICSNDPCPKTAPFFYLEDEESSTQPKICLSNCAKKDFIYFIVSEDTEDNIINAQIFVMDIFIMEDVIQVVQMAFIMKLLQLEEQPRKIAL